jgi:3-deoxy-D-manno-octulosonic-acid transferase
VSVGEVNLIRGLVDRLTAEGVEVVLSVTTDTGWATAGRLYGGMSGVSVVRYPLDFSWMVGRFLEAVRPDVVGLVELEVWPNFVSACRRRGIAVGVVNGRLSERSFGRYGLPGIRGRVRGTFGGLDFVAAQSEVVAERFVGLGVARERVSVLDTMKWDGASVGLDGALREQAGRLAEEIGLGRVEPRGRERVVVLAGTGDGEEVGLVGALRSAWDQGVDDGEGAMVVLVVPRKPERFDEVASGLGALMGAEVARRSAGGRLARRPGGGARDASGMDVVLIDTLGELRACDALADAVIVGRSFNGWGGSDPMEAAGLGVASVMGPDHQNFEAVVGALVAGGGLVVEATPAAAAARVVGWLTTEGGAAEAAAVGRAGQGVIGDHRGSTERHLALLMSWLRQDEGQGTKDEGLVGER